MRDSIKQASPQQPTSHFGLRAALPPLSRARSAPPAPHPTQPNPTTPTTATPPT
jgi:hypothetical protein